MICWGTHTAVVYERDKQTDTLAVTRTVRPRHRLTLRSPPRSLKVDIRAQMAFTRTHRSDQAA